MLKYYQKSYKKDKLPGQTEKKTMLSTLNMVFCRSGCHCNSIPHILQSLVPTTI